MSAPHEPAIDLDRLMSDLKARVAARRAAGDDDGDVLETPFDAPGADAAGGLSVRLRPETAYSSKPVVGRVITFGKRLQIRVLYHFLDDLATQANAALTGLRAALEAETRAREALEERVRELERDRDEAVRAGQERAPARSDGGYGEARAPSPRRR